MTDLDLRVVRYFVAAAEELHFGRAAQRLFISQQTLSAQIAKLENDLGVALFNRSGRQVQLTRAGQQFLDEGRSLLEQARRSISVVQGTGNTVRLASINDQIDTVPRILEACRRRAPELQLECILAPVSEQVRLVRSGELDVALGRAFRLPSGLSSKVFRLDRAHVIAPRGHPIGASAEPLPWRALNDISIQVPSTRYAPQLTSFLDELKADRGLSFTIAPRGSTSLEISLAQVEREGIVQLGFDSFEVSEEGVVDRLMTEPMALYAWSAIWLSGNPNPGVTRLLNVIREASQELDWMQPPLPAEVWLPLDDVNSQLAAELLTRISRSNLPPRVRS